MFLSKKIGKMNRMKTLLFHYLRGYRQGRFPCGRADLMTLTFIVKKLSEMQNIIYSSKFLQTFIDMVQTLFKNLNIIHSSKFKIMNITFSFDKEIKK